MLCTCLPPPRSATLSSSGVLSPASCPKAGVGEGGAGRRWKVSNFSSKWDRSERIRFSGQHSTFHPSTAFASLRRAEPTRKAYWLPNNSTQLANTLTGTRHVHREGFATCSTGEHIACACARKTARRPRDPPPPPQFGRWCQRLQSAICFKFMINRYFAQPMKSFPISPMKSFTLYKQSRWK